MNLKHFTIKVLFFSIYSQNLTTENYGAKPKARVGVCVEPRTLWMRAERGLWVTGLTAVSPLLLFIGGVPSVGHQPCCVFHCFKLLLMSVLWNTCERGSKGEGERNKERQTGRKGVRRGERQGVGGGEGRGGQSNRTKWKRKPNQEAHVRGGFLVGLIRNGSTSHVHNRPVQRHMLREREKKKRETKNIYKKSVSVGSTSWKGHTGLHSSPIPPRGEIPFHATDNSTEEMSGFLRIGGNEFIHTREPGVTAWTGRTVRHAFPRPFSWSRSRDRAEGRRWRRHENPGVGKLSELTPHNKNE